MRAYLDWVLVVAYLLAGTISLTILFSISPDRLPTQAISLAIGLLLLIYLTRQDYVFFQAISWPCYILTVTMLLATLIFGENVRGSIRWINIAGFQFQASEFTKPLLILAFSQFFVQFPLKNFKNIILNVSLFLLPMLLIFRQPDLGTALVITAIWSAQFLMSGAPWWTYAGGFLSGILAIIGAPKFLHDYQLRRLTSFIDPSQDPLASGYNVIQSIIAVGSGGFLGKGLGHGTQSHLRFLPERHTDFVFASLAEELGLVGGIVVLTVLSSILFRLLSIVMRSDSKSGRLIAIGIFAYIAFQTFVNIGMNIGLAPVTGITLPLISYGGSSAVATGIALGLAGSVARGGKSDPSIEIK